MRCRLYALIRPARGTGVHSLARTRPARRRRLSDSAGLHSARPWSPPRRAGASTAGRHGRLSPAPSAYPGRAATAYTRAVGVVQQVPSRPG
ncbi:hypothetical protein GH714_044135 [Hevea brasiliensis]|uniref:Uncharacterized protein n=1 Tax=Hevea brasiliensis TaxID=3981 RepID=A0A6A6K0E9_HEVBR|nr:hypothetical protein GH714_044135 [Hevea brasiliensis]